MPHCWKSHVTAHIDFSLIVSPCNRYAVKVTEDHLTSIQMNTSKTDVYIKLTVLNNEEEVASTIGKGHAVIPAFQFLKDINPEEELKRSSSRTCKLS